MRRLTLVAASLACALTLSVVVHGALARADGGRPVATPPTITAIVSQPGSGDDDDDPASPEPVTCVWVSFPAASSLADKFNDVDPGVWDLSITIDLGYYSYDGALHRYNLGSGQFERR